MSVAPPSTENRAAIPVASNDRSTPLQPDLMPVSIILDRLRSAFNVGNIFRLAEAVRAERILACGYTAAPPHPKLAKTARGCDRLVPCVHMPTSLEAIAELRSRGYTIYGVETTDRATLIWDEVIPFPAAVVFGNEALGIEAETLAACDGWLKIPAMGCKNSINVANCAAVVLYEMWHQWRTQSSPIKGKA